MKRKSKKTTGSDNPGTESSLAHRVEKGTSGAAKMKEIGKIYERVPHPTLKNTFILREKASSNS